MNGYKVLLVDDEEEVRQAIARKLNWEELGFQLVGEAGNGEEALELLHTLQPDVIMTDIKMPFMDGLTLCRLAKEQLPGVKVAIFSGFDEFEYAKEAIKLEVEEYILKPINANELAKVFQRLYATLNKEMAARKDMQRLRRYYEESLPLMRQQLLLNLLEGKVGPAILHAKMEEYGLEMVEGPYCVAIINYHITNNLSTAAKNVTNNLQLHSFSLQQLIIDSLTGGPAHLLIPSLDRLVLLFMLDNQATERNIIALLNQLFLPAQKFLDMSLSIGIGTCCGRLEEVSRSYEEAESALEYQVLVGQGQCVFIGDIEPSATNNDIWDKVNISEVVRQIKIGPREKLQEAVQSLVFQLKESAITLHQYQIFLLEIFTELLKLIKTYKLESNSTDISDRLLEKNVHSFKNLDEMGHWLLDYCDQLRQMIRRERKNSTRQLVEQAKEYMETRYPDNNFSVDTLCGELNVSPAYFSTIFKKETGLSFVSYLTQLRLEKALEYLNTTDEKTYIIAEKVGYTDANYFSYVFKKQYGISPSKYRSTRMANDELGQKSS